MVEKLLKERTPLYEKYADLTIDVSDSRVEETVEYIIEKLNRIGYSR